MTQLSKKIKDFDLKDNTLSRKVKDYAPNRIELEIGDSKEPGQFMPQAKVMRWDNEVNLSVRRQKPQPKDRIRRLRARVPTADVQGDHVTYDDDDETVHIYERPEIGEDGGLEIELHLKHKPDTNRFDFSIQTKGLNFYYQPEITHEEVKNLLEYYENGEIKTRTVEEAKRLVRPENVVGSYAVYHATKRDNTIGSKEYKTGKFCHIYRPHITDADGNETWGELELDEQSGLLTVVVPQAFLDKATYPVVVDPTFGYESVGASSLQLVYITCCPTYNHEDQGTEATLSEAGDVTALDINISTVNTTASLYGSIYKKDGNAPGSHSLETNDSLAAVSTTGWKTLSGISASLAADDYILWVGASDDIEVAYDSSGGSSYYKFNTGSSLVGNGTDPLAHDSTLSQIVSIYATYTAAATSPTKIKVGGTFQAVTPQVKIGGTFTEVTPKIKQGGTFS